MTHHGALHPAPAADAGAAAVVLQRKCACGNTASRLTGACDGCRPEKTLGLQAKLVVSAANDPYEQEADRVAEGVLALPTPVREPVRTVASPLVSRRGSGEPAAALATPASVTAALPADRGEPLSTAARAFFEPRFGHDFSRVRIHSGGRAATLARALDARAFTVGRGIGFAAGEFDPQSSAGRRLLAHELVHTIQQSAATWVPDEINSRDTDESLAAWALAVLKRSCP